MQIQSQALSCPDYNSKILRSAKSPPPSAVKKHYNQLLNHNVSTQSIQSDYLESLYNKAWSSAGRWDICNRTLGSVTTVSTVTQVLYLNTILMCLYFKSIFFSCHFTYLWGLAGGGTLRSGVWASSQMQIIINLYNPKWTSDCWSDRSNLKSPETDIMKKIIRQLKNISINPLLSNTANKIF